MAARHEGIVADANGKLINWLISTDATIKKGTILGVYETMVNNIVETKRIICDTEGDHLVKRIVVDQQQDFNVGQMLIEIDRLERLTVSTKVAGKLASLYIQEGEMVDKGQLLGSVQPDDKSLGAKHKSVRSPSCGRIEKIIRNVGDQLPAKTPIIQLVVEECRHTTIIRDMCATCGKDLSKSKSKKRILSVKGYSSSIILPQPIELTSCNSINFC